ncbi:hypothetical protein [Ochrobactrum sp. 3-3]|uniref:hypothetical protein n=1 Tax=Ochrobactrum sp. 3-3 TaxID=1830124 RepID=UPI000DEF0549|nr:hypothetical protein [Ochrobactrum sp. 3-3]
MTAPPPTTNAIIPGSLTDFARSLRELIGALHDLAELVGDGGKVALGIYRREQSSRAAQNLDTLSFAPQGSRMHLESIAAGRGTSADIDAIAASQEATAFDVEMSMQQLSHYRGPLRKALGRDAAERLDNLIYGPFGKTRLRNLLADLVCSYEGKEPVPESAVADAAAILKSVEALNAEITALHDEILGFRK